MTNPLWNNLSVGTVPVFNRLLWAYGLPALLFALVSRKLLAHQPLMALGSGLAGLLSTFLLVTLEVRQYFRGNLLNQGAVSSAENYAYSFAWLSLGILLVAASIRRQNAVLRYSSLAIMILAVLKVFLYDTARLDDIFRVLSLLALGGSLFLLAFIYQRFVFPASKARSLKS